MVHVPAHLETFVPFRVSPLKIFYFRQDKRPSSSTDRTANYLVKRRSTRRWRW
jgi:hypothetical protein